MSNEPERQFLLQLNPKSRASEDSLKWSREQVSEVLRLLSPREELVLKMRFGVGDGYGYSRKEVGASFNVTADFIGKIERRALRKLRDALTATAKNARTLGDETAERRYRLVLEETIASVKALTPELIEHLRQHHDRIDQIPPAVLEQLVAELLASWGWDEVRLVGRSPDTSADILAGYHTPGLGSRVRVFVEVKRLRSRVGIEVVQNVFGAMIAERPRMGWNAALIVATGGFKELRKFSVEELRLKGVELRDKEDLVRWLADYRPGTGGLWLPQSLV